MTAATILGLRMVPARDMRVVEVESASVVDEVERRTFQTTESGQTMDSDKTQEDDSNG
jgi:hypothetical protein